MNENEHKCTYMCQRYCSKCSLELYCGDRCEDFCVDCDHHDEVEE